MLIEPLFYKTITGSKTMTRRDGGLKSVNGDEKNPDNTIQPDNYILSGFISVADQRAKVSFINTSDPEDVVYCQSNYKQGEFLFLKEPTTIVNGEVIYAYDNPPGRDTIKFDNKMFFKPERARHFIKITEIKCERLLDISPADALKEGMMPYRRQPFRVNPPPFVSLVDQFFTVYRKANGKGEKSELRNIWVWSYSYERVWDPSEIKILIQSCRNQSKSLLTKD